MRYLLFGVCMLILVSENEVSSQNITVDGAKKYQTIHGLGVNINPQSWNANPESVKSVIDSLIMGMGCTSFRLMFDDCDWESANDNNDPNLYNWTYYDSIYAAPRFTSVWNTINYLNSKGITDITLSPDGAAPVWMGGTKLNQGSEAEYAEMMTSMVYYDLKHRSPAIQFSLLSPINETTCGGSEAPVTRQTFSQIIPAFSVFTLAGNNKKDSGVAALTARKPEPKDWYAGDMHVHRNCGEGTSVLPETEFTVMMETNDLAVISVLADMGDGEVKDSKTDLPKVNGTDAVQSIPGRTVHWDAEWHFDPAGTTFENKALGGHVVLLGLSEAHRIWDESPYKILEYGRSQHAIVGFCHMQYLKDSIPDTLDCCTPIDYPVEAALGTIDFLAEDVWLNDASVNAYYKLLNCGFRPGWAAGTDFPCNNSQPFGSLLTYVQVKNKPFSYRQWVEGIKNGRTVVTTNGHREFLDLKVNGNSTPGDEIALKDKGTLGAEVIWTSVLEQTGRIELILNGKVVATKEGTAKPGEPVILKASVPIQESSWLCARRMDEKGHRSHTAPVYITLKNAPVRASTEDARYFVKWIDKTLVNTAQGGPWNKYFTHDLDVVRNRYLQARKVYEEIALEATKAHKR